MFKNVNPPPRGGCILLEGEPKLSLIIFIDSSVSKFLIKILGVFIKLFNISSVIEILQ